MSSAAVYPRSIHYQNENDEEKTLTIYQELETDVGGVVWDSALVAIHYFFKHPNTWRNKKVLELGSGTGACGIALAALGAEVIVTDLAERIPLIQQNINANFPNTSNEIKAEFLDWTIHSAPENLDLILAVDCVYYNSSIGSLIDFFRKCGAKEIIIASEKRDIGEASDAQKTFFESVTEYFNVVNISKNDLSEDYYSDDIIIAKLERKL